MSGDQPYQNLPRRIPMLWKFQVLSGPRKTVQQDNRKQNTWWFCWIPKKLNRNNGDFPMKNCYFPMKNCDFPSSIHRFRGRWQQRIVSYPELCAREKRSTHPIKSSANTTWGIWRVSRWTHIWPIFISPSTIFHPWFIFDVRGFGILLRARWCLDISSIPT